MFLYFAVPKWTWVYDFQLWNNGWPSHPSNRFGEHCWTKQTFGISLFALWCVFHLVEYFYCTIFIMQIPSKDFYCVGFRIQEEFETGMTRASVFRVYEFYDQGICVSTNVWFMSGWTDFGYIKWAFSSHFNRK